MKQDLWTTALVLIIISGCARAPSKVRAFFCGCQACSEVAEILGGETLSKAEVVFAGGPGDAASFGTDHQIQNVIPDGTGALKLDAGISTCPAFIVEGRIFGDKSPIPKSDLEWIKKKL